MVAGSQRRRAEGRRHSRRGPTSHPRRPRILDVRNQQRIRGVRLLLLQQIARALLQETWPDRSYDLAICLVAAPEMTRLNETFLRHKGSTDVITFDYAEKAGQASRLSLARPAAGPELDRRPACPANLHGEIFVCLDEAVRQARRFRTTWQSELVRYVVHGILHLLGYDDCQPRPRRRMRAAENVLVRRLARQFAFRALSRPRI